MSISPKDVLNKNKNLNKRVDVSKIKLDNVSVDDLKYNGKNYEECLKTAVAYGSAACLTEGTKPPRREDIEKLFNTIHTKKAGF